MSDEIGATRAPAQTLVPGTIDPAIYNAETDTAHQGIKRILETTPGTTIEKLTPQAAFLYGQAFGSLLSVVSIAAAEADPESGMPTTPKERGLAFAQLIQQLPDLLVALQTMHLAEAAGGHDVAASDADRALYDRFSEFAVTVSAKHLGMLDKINRGEYNPSSPQPFSAGSTERLNASSEGVPPGVTIN